jgi:uncharacterized protein
MYYLNIPGLSNSGPQHWQSIWEKLYPKEFGRVEQQNWLNPIKDVWVSALNKKINKLSSPVILVAHSLGCITAVHWALSYSSPLVKGAVLVAPADVEKLNQEGIKTFCPVPLVRLSLPSAIVASTNDPYASLEQCAEWGAYWGSKLISVGDKGHINAQSGIAEWEEGLLFLKTFDKNYHSHE